MIIRSTWVKLISFGFIYKNEKGILLRVLLKVVLLYSLSSSNSSLTIGIVLLFLAAIAFGFFGSGDGLACVYVLYCLPPLPS
jgi:hypothetical protein